MSGLNITNASKSNKNKRAKIFYFAQTDAAFTILATL